MILSANLSLIIPCVPKILLANLLDSNYKFIILLPTTLLS